MAETGEFRVHCRRELWARASIRKLRSQGHIYIELRQDRKRFIYFCTLCLAPCYSYSNLCDHLTGKFHRGSLAYARIALMKPNPWPFNDGMRFFHYSPDKEQKPPIAVWNAHRDLVIPNVHQKDKVSDLKVRFMGIGKIFARILENDTGWDEIKRIWCEWLGNNSDNSTHRVGKHEFSVIVFVYNYNVGRDPLLDDLKDLLSREELEGIEATRKEILEKTSLSDENFTDSRSLVKEYDNLFELSKCLKNKRMRVRYRQQLKIAAEAKCPICQHKMLPGKDVATLLNMKTGKLSCSSTNLFGLFKYKIKMSDGLREWMRSPEVLENCSTGFHFPSQHEETVQEKVLPLKLLHFYHAEQ